MSAIEEAKRLLGEVSLDIGLDAQRHVFIISNEARLKIGTVQAKLDNMEKDVRITFEHLAGAMEKLKRVHGSDNVDAAEDYIIAAINRINGLDESPEEPKCDHCADTNREIYVVTKVPTWPASTNLCGDALKMAETDRGKYTFYVLDDWQSELAADKHGAILIPIKREIFRLGEVIVCDGAGKEVGGFQRKPMKRGYIKSDDPDDNLHKNTGLEFEEFNNIGDALKCSHEVLRERMKPPAEEHAGRAK